MIYQMKLKTLYSFFDDSHQANLQVRNELNALYTSFENDSFIDADSSIQVRSPLDAMNRMHIDGSRLIYCNVAVLIYLLKWITNHLSVRRVTSSGTCARQ